MDDVWAAADRYLRSRDTVLARGVRQLAPAVGAAYASSRSKRGLDLLLAVPGAALALPVCAALLIVTKILSPRQAALFVQVRQGRHGPMDVFKIRSLSGGRDRPGSRATRFGHWMRRWYLDELPQVLQALAGELSVVGIRVLPVDVYQLLARTWPPDRFEQWDQAYRSAPLGLTGIHQVYRRRGKDDLRRYHRDLFYARHASLGLDLYLLWRTARCAGRVPG